jgi:hypothetical protein
MGWVIGGLIALIIALLIKIIVDLRKLIEAGSHNGPPAATSAGLAAMQGALLLIQTINGEDRKPTTAECKQLKDLYEAAQAGNVSALAVEPLRNAIDLLCD